MKTIIEIFIPRYETEIWNRDLIPIYEVPGVWYRVIWYRDLIQKYESEIGCRDLISKFDTSDDTEIWYVLRCYTKFWYRKLKPRFCSRYETVGKQNTWGNARSFCPPSITRLVSSLLNFYDLGILAFFISYYVGFGSYFGTRYFGI